MSQDLKFRYIEGRGSVPIHEPKNNNIAKGVATTVVLSMLAGSGAGSASSIRGVTSEYSQRPYVREFSARTTSATDSVKVIFRMQRLGHRVRVQATTEESNCATYSTGEVHRFFIEHPCRSLYRSLIELQNKKSIMLVALSRIEMSDYETAEALRKLLARPANGKISQLTPRTGKYRNIPFADAFFTTTQNGTIVTSIDAKPIGRTRDRLLLYSVLTSARAALGAPSP